MNLLLHTVKMEHGVGEFSATTSFVEGNPIYLDYGSIVYVSSQPYPETVEGYGDKLYSEIGLSSGHVLTIFEQPDEVIAMIAEEERKVMEEINKDLASYGVQRT